MGEGREQWNLVWDEADAPVLLFVRGESAAPVYENKAAHALGVSVCGSDSSNGNGCCLLWASMSGEERQALAREAAEETHSTKPVLCLIGKAVYSAAFFSWRGEIVCTLQDVTGYYQENQRIINEAVLASQAKTNFLSEMSHDIRTPMNAIVGMTEIALKQQHLSGKVRECLKKIQIASGTMMELLNDVLDMSRIESGRVLLQMGPLEIADLLHEVLVVVRPLAKKKQIHFLVRTGVIDCERIVGDVIRLKQICNNLLSNAVKFTPEGGKVELYVEICRQRKAERKTADGSSAAGLTVLDTPLQMTLQVRDTGIGMSQEFLRKVFDPFEREQNSTVSGIQGTGLGMAITKNLTELMGGSISVDSRQGEGSCFTVRIPARATEEREDAHREAFCGKRVLVFDSSAQRGKAAEELLRELGMEADCVQSADDVVCAINDAMFAGRDYFAFLAAERDPGVELLSFLRSIRERMGSEFPMLLMSENDWSQIEYMYTSVGVDAFIPVPLFRSRLSSCLFAFTEAGRHSRQQEEQGMVRDFGGKRVLLVEDNELNREIAGEMLEEASIRVEMAVNGQEAVRMVERSAPYYYEMILMDIQMPVLNGLDAARAIRKLPREDVQQLPIIAMTANAFLEDVKNSLDAGMNAHLSKPLDMEQVFSCMEKYMRRPGK